VVHGSSAADGSKRITLRRANQAAVAAQREAERASRLAAIDSAAGFAAVMEALRDCGRPCVGHNMWLDLTYALQVCFTGLFFEGGG
jgi:poly(A)-specific ribonuclease